MLFSKPKKAIGIDIGTHSVKSVLMSRTGGRLRVDGAAVVLVDRNQVNVDPIAAQADALRESVRRFPVSTSLVVGALPGHTVVIRYPRLPDMPERQIESAVLKEAGQHIPYELSEVFLDSTLLDTVADGDERFLKMLLVAAKHEVIDARVQVANAAGIEFGIMGVDSLALADAAEGCDFLRVGETVALVNIGLGSASVHFVKDGVSNFIRDISWGTRELVQAIARARRCEYEQAERALAASAAASPESVAPVAAPAEPVAPAKPAASGGSLLDPFEEELDTTPVEAPPPAAAASEKSVEEIISVPLSRLVNEVRRSFEYYEHELYERPVDRLVLSGGIAHLPVLANTLGEELGLKSVEVANPLESALFFGHDDAVSPLLDHPAQFMVALGLAARGMADI